MLFLPEGQMGQAWEPSKKQCHLKNQQALNRKMSSLFSAFKG
jgi:hypothetical protein